MSPTRYASYIILSITGLIVVVVGSVLLIAVSLGASLVGFALALLIGAFAAALLIGVTVIAGSPILRDVLTSYRTLLSLENLSHPLLVELQEKAPGTYHHSLQTAALAYEATKKIGGNAVLARVGAYYHDIGKLKHPHYYIENQTGQQDPHAALSPKQSAKIIIEHIINGIEMARRHRLPTEIVDFIPEHTGTTLVYYFYIKAKKVASKGEEVYKRDFRYPGPKPMSKETGIVMLADSVEATARTLKDATREQLRKMVNEIITIKVDDRQLDICGLTSKDIEDIKSTFVEVLDQMSHKRVKYPRRPSGKLHGKQ